MSNTVADLIRRIRALEDELELQLALARAEFHVILDGGKVAFERAVRQRHAKFKTRLGRYVLGARLRVLFTAPVIYSLIVPFVLLDLAVSLYQAVCFPAYGIAKVRRADYLVFDRRHLAYLNALERLNCTYCSYANGLIAYVREIAARTEQYWCPIRHARRIAGSHGRYAEFLDFGDAEAWPARSAELRQRLREPGKD